jgi:hypothetical protein
MLAHLCLLLALSWAAPLLASAFTSAKFFDEAG